MRINPFVFGVFVLVLFLGPVFAAQAAGVWSVSGKVTATGEKVVPTGGDVDEIKGWMTLDDVSAAFDVPVEEITAAFDLPPGTSGSAQLKELESEEFSVTDLRTWLTERMKE